MLLTLDYLVRLYSTQRPRSFFAKDAKKLIWYHLRALRESFYLFITLAHSSHFPRRDAYGKTLGTY